VRHARDALGLARLARTLESYSHCRTPLTTFHTASTFGVYLPMRPASHVHGGTLPHRPNARCEFGCKSQAGARRAHDGDELGLLGMPLKIGNRRAVARQGAECARAHAVEDVPDLDHTAHIA
jgi:hypothetical protein